MSAVPANALLDELAAGTLVLLKQLDLGFPAVRVGAVYRATTPLSTAAQSLLHLIEAEFSASEVGA